MKSTFNRFCIFSLIFITTGCRDCKEKTGCTNTYATNYNPEATIGDNCSCLFNGINTSCSISNPEAIEIPSIQQETEVWCWLAVGEMIFRYYGLPAVNGANEYQCGIVAAVGYSMNGACDKCNLNCGNCVVPAGSASMVSYMLSVYPKIACRDLYDQNQTLNSTFVSNFLSSSFLITELNENRPVIAGINPGTQFVLPGNSQHVALVTGYFYDGNNNLILEVNDPFPYWTSGFDPYLFNGAFTNGDLSYQIPYVNFVNGLQWNTSWYDIGW